MLCVEGRFVQPPELSFGGGKASFQGDVAEIEHVLLVIGCLVPMCGPFCCACQEMRILRCGQYLPAQRCTTMSSSSESFDLEVLTGPHTKRLCQCSANVQRGLAELVLLAKTRKEKTNKQGFISFDHGGRSCWIINTSAILEIVVLITLYYLIGNRRHRHSWLKERSSAFGQSLHCVQVGTTVTAHGPTLPYVALR